MIKWLMPISSKYPGALEALVSKVKDGSLPCGHRQFLPSGDIRYWAADPGHSPLLSEFRDLALRAHGSRGKQPEILLMINYISAETCPTGSGDGWHVDSVRRQFKLFCYLTDCLSEKSGPLCILDHPVPGMERLVILGQRLLRRSRRFDEGTITLLERLGFRRHPLLSTAGRPFFVETSRIHRGLPIQKGHRIMMAAYLYEDGLPPSIRDVLASGRDGAN